ncbi:hypothetical protein KM043_000785 [Ampulex compressa]|nr:hypothetical protein KM043_000785 [Ampulex compressa]
MTPTARRRSNLRAGTSAPQAYRIVRCTVRCPLEASLRAIEPALLAKDQNAALPFASSTSLVALRNGKIDRPRVRAASRKSVREERSPRLSSLLLRSVPLAATATITARRSAQGRLVEKLPSVAFLPHARSGRTLEIRGGDQSPAGEINLSHKLPESSRRPGVAVSRGGYRPRRGRGERVLA